MKPAPQPESPSLPFARPVDSSPQGIARLAIGIGVFGACAGLDRLAWCRLGIMPVVSAPCVILLALFGAASGGAARRTAGPSRMPRIAGGLLGLLGFLAMLLGRTPAAIGSSIAAAFIVALFAVPTAWARRLTDRPTHDATDQIHIVASVVLAVIAFVQVSVQRLFSIDTELWEGAALGAVLVTSVLFTAVALRRDLGRRRWLEALFAGRTPGWLVVPSAESVWAETIPYLPASQADAAIIWSGSEAPFRHGALQPARAWISRDSAAAASLLRRRIVLALGVLLSDGVIAMVLPLEAGRHLTPLGNVVQVVAGPDQTCARVSDGRVYCWGVSGRRGIPNHLGTCDFDPTAIEIPALRGAVDLSFGDDTVCAHNGAGEDRCVMRGQPLHEPLRRIPDRSPTVAAPGDHRCEIRTSVVGCAGANRDGELGDGTTSRRSEWAAVQGLPHGATEVVAMHGFTCARIDDGTVWCWGRLLSQREAHAPPLPPAQVPGLRGVVQIKADAGNLWARLENGTVWSWDGSATPVRLTAVHDVTGFVDAVDEWCVIEHSGRVGCWRFGRPTTLRRVLDGAEDLTAGGQHICVRLRDGSVRCWGKNFRGQLGDGTNRPRSGPVTVRQ